MTLTLLDLLESLEMRCGRSGLLSLWVLRSHPLLVSSYLPLRLSFTESLSGIHWNCWGYFLFNPNTGKKANSPARSIHYLLIFFLGSIGYQHCCQSSVCWCGHDCFTAPIPQYQKRRIHLCSCRSLDVPMVCQVPHEVDLWPHLYFHRNLLSTSNNFTTYLSAYTVFLSSIPGVIICDYYSRSPPLLLNSRLLLRLQSVPLLLHLWLPLARLHGLRGRNSD